MTDRQHEATTSQIGQLVSKEEVEAARRERALELNSRAGSRPQLEARYGQVWAPEELARAFEVIGFAAPYVVVRCKRDGQMGSLEFQHHPRFYFNFEQDQPT